MREKWKRIPFAPTHEASNIGRVRYGKKVLHQVRHKTRHGHYFRVRIYGRAVMVHRCVLAAFRGESRLWCVAYTKFFSRLFDLTPFLWLVSENVQHAYDMGLNDGRVASKTWKRLHATGAIKYARGEACRHAKLTEAQVREIRASPLGPIALTKIYPVCRGTIWGIRQRKKWRHL